MNFVKNLVKLIKTKSDTFELSELKEILGTNDERYLLDFAKEVEIMGVGKYYSSDCTVEKLFIYKEKVGKIALLKAVETVKDIIK